MKAQILQALKTSDKHDFYKQAVRSGCAFDVHVDGKKFEICPKRLSGYACGATATHGWDESIDISAAEIYACAG